MVQLHVMNKATCKTSKTLAAVSVIALALGLSACASKPASVPGLDSQYHFGYSIKWTGPVSSKPVQVFSDQSHTYFQLATPNSPAPTFFAVSPQGLTPVTAVRNGQYMVVNGTASQWQLMRKSARGTVSAPSGVSPTIQPMRSPSAPAAMSAAHPAPRYSAGQASAISNNIQNLKDNITQLNQSIAGDKKHLYEHSNPEPSLTHYSLSILFPSGGSKIGVRAYARVSQMARLASQSYRVTLRGVATPGGSRSSNLHLCGLRVTAVKKLLLGLGVPSTSLVILPPSLDGQYPHVALRFSISNQEGGQ